MKKHCVLFLMMPFIFACVEEILYKNSDNRIFRSEDVQPANIDSSNANNKPDLVSKALKINLGDETVSGSIDAYGNVFIEYPSVLYGNIELLRFDGNLDKNERPFSKEYCHNIRQLAEYGLGNFVRSGYHRSVFKFKMPVYVSSIFTHEIMKKSESFGYAQGALYVRNPIEYYYGKVNIILGENSISRSIGDIGFLEEQLNLSAKGAERDDYSKEVFIFSRDIICDLITKQAKIEMIYPIKGQNKDISVFFDSLKIPDATAAR